jgi:predicted metal-dependent peptidase
MDLQPADEDTLDLNQLSRELDKAKSSVFLGKNAAFLGSLMCTLNFVWTRGIPSAGTDAVTLWWNPDWFMTLDPKVRETVLLHELWHAARLHMIREGSRNHEIWNYACDIRINNDLENEGYSFLGVEDCWKDHSVDHNGTAAEEDIYDLLMQHQNPPPPSGSWGDGKSDMIPMSESQKQTAVNNVVQAVQQAKVAGQAGNLPGGIEETLKKFLEPVIPWQSVLMQFFTDLLNEDFTWKRPNRRHQNIYLPSRYTDDGRLEHLMYFLDVSGSIRESDLLRFNSEVKYIQETLKPQKLTLVQFDTKITDVKEFKEDDPFDEIKIKGRGGTSFVPVKQYIEKHKPTAAIIFSDMYCAPMEPLQEEIPIIWVAIDNRGATVPFGKLIHISD